MASFGNFETEREVYSDAIHSVYGARKAGDNTAYALKVFSIQRIGFEEETRTEIESLLGDLERSRIKCIEIQRKAAESSGYIAPVLETGYDERGVWYATRFYPRSVNIIISGRVALTREPLLHILRSIAQGALDLKRACGRSHGDIQPSNIQISKSDQLAEAEVVLSDPLPGGEEEAARYELADLRAIGQILLQLVRQRAIGDEHGFLILPILASPEWNRLFGKDTERWLSLCNQLLDPKLSLDHLTLEKVLAELEQLQPKRPVSGKLLVSAAAVVLLLAGGAFVISQLMAYQKLRVTSDPPGAVILVNKKEEGKTPRTIKLKKGAYEIQARQDNLRLLERTTNLVVTGGAEQPLHFQFAYGSVSIVSEPAGAIITNNGVFVGKTPFTIPIVASDVPVKYELSLSEHGSKTVQGVVTNGRTLALSEKLPLDRESGTLDMESTPNGAQVFWNGKLLTPESGTPAKTTLEQGPYTLTAIHSDLGTQQISIEVKRGDAVPAKFYFPNGKVSLDTTPSDAVVWVGTNRIGTTPMTARRPPGKTTFRFELSGYETNVAEVMVADKGTHSISPTLKILAGFVDVISDPPGAQIVDLDHPEKVLGVTAANKPSRIHLPPGKHALRATYGDLKSIDSARFDIKVGQPTPVPPFAFEYGTVVFAEIGPPDALEQLSIQRAGTRGLKIGDRVLQKPAEPVSYRIEAPGYEPVINNVVVGVKETKPIRLALMRKTVQVKLSSDPPGAKFFTSQGTELKGNGGNFLLPWGTVDLIAHFARLGTLTNMAVPIRLEGQNEIPPFKFDYGTVILTNLPDSYTVREGGEELLIQPGPLRFAYERPGPHKYELYEGSQSIDIISTNITKALNFLRSAVDPNQWVNGKGMRFQWVSGLPDGGTWTGGGLLSQAAPGGLVGQFEVTQNQYLMMDGTNPSAFQGKTNGNYPVENLSWKQAKAFCDWLNANDPKKPATWVYTLPSEAQYVYFGADADLAGQVSSVDRATDKRTHPEEVGSTRKPNRFRLHDVVGNVCEWVATPGVYRGGGFQTSAKYKIGISAREANRELDPSVGFRVILVPVR
jgi:hypothetical protein